MYDHTYNIIDQEATKSCANSVVFRTHLCIYMYIILNSHKYIDNGMLMAKPKRGERLDVV